MRAEEVERQRFQEAQEEGSKTAEKETDTHRRQKSENGHDNQDQEPSRSGLRKRGGGSAVSEDVSSSVSVATAAGMATSDSTSSGIDDATKTKKKKKKERNPDPLLWFGVFVPASLRSAQSVFQQGKKKNLKDFFDSTISRVHVYLQCICIYGQHILRFARSIF